MAAFRGLLLVLAFVAACLVLTEAARRINVQEQMQLRARRSVNVNGDEAPKLMLGLTEGEELEETTEITTAKGTKKVKFQETFNGVKVVGATVVLEKDDKGHYSNEATGELVADLSEDLPNTLPQLSVNEAFHMIVVHNKDNLNEIRFDPNVDATLEVTLEEGNEGERPHGRLMYKIAYMVESEDEVSRPFTLMDANNGDIVKQWNGISMNRMARKAERVKSASQINGVGGNEKIGKVEYGKNYPKLKVDNACVLENNVAKVYDCGGRTYSCDASTPFTFNCKDGFDDSVNGAYSPLSDALFYITATYEMFHQWYDIQKPLQRPGTNESICMSRVHYGRRYENAFWDGRYITFGDGASRFYPLTSINVVAHEISHGITEMNSGLQYWGESGGMNEAFSDMAGEAVEFFASKNQDWMVGYEIFKDPDGALRYFKDPTKDGKSIGTHRDYCTGMDPHYSSGLFNRVFYFLGETKGWDVRTAFHPFVLANTLYWKEDSRFFHAACGVVQAAKDLGMDTEAVTAAFKKVGVVPCVDTSIGIAATSGLSGPAGEEMLLRTIVTESMNLDHMTVSVDSKVDMDVQIRSPACSHCGEKLRAHSHKEFEICGATPGVYEVSLTPEEKMWGTTVAFFGASVFIIQNVTLSGYRSIYETKFEMPDFVIQNDLQVSLELTSSYGSVYGYLRHGEKPDLSNYYFDYRLRRNSETLLCNAKPGTWYITLKSYEYVVRNVYVDLQSILTGRKVTESTTTPAPTESGSGSGDTESEGEEIYI